MRRVITLLALLACCTSAVFAQQSPVLEKGFAADKLYDFSQVDSVNTFNGNLTLGIPLGGSYPVQGNLGYSLHLSYNSKVWDYETIAGKPRAIANRRSNAGMGWTVSLGKIITPTDPTNTIGGYVYESPDGGLHGFSDKLHDSDPATVLSGTVKGVGYTRDGTYLRMLRKDTNADTVIDTIEVESPDGTVRVFSAFSGNLTTIKDRYLSSVTIDEVYSVTETGTACTATPSFAFAWKITDSQSRRTNYVCFRGDYDYEDSAYQGQVERVVLAAPPDPTTGSPRTATYQFIHTPSNVHRGCYSTYVESQTVYGIPLLTRVVLPDGSNYNFTYNLASVNHCETGTMSSVQIPTGAKTEYTYRNYAMPASICNKFGAWNSQSVGVVTRKITGSRIPTAQWTYSPLLANPPQAMADCEDGNITTRVFVPSESFTNTIVDPMGNVTIHYYSVWPLSPGESLYSPSGALLLDANGQPLQTSPNGTKASEFGLPFSRISNSGGRFISRRYHTAAGHAANPRQTLWTQYLTYESDAVTCSPTAVCPSANARVLNDRKTYHDDGNKVADILRSDFDGLGHYRTTRFQGTIGGAVTTQTVAYNTRDANVNPSTGIASGSYPGTFTPPTLQQSWILDMAPRSVVTEGTNSATVHMCYDWSTGALLARRTLKTGTTRAGSDLLAVYGIDAYGNISREMYYGGDIKANAPTSGSLCATAAAPPSLFDYQINHTRTSSAVTAQHTGAPFLTIDQTIDLATGLPTAENMPDGQTTRYEYDTSRRLKKLTLPGTAPMTYSYFNTSGTGTTFVPARVAADMASAQGEGTVTHQYQYDPLGRLWRTKQRMPDNSWAIEETLYNALGMPSATAARQNFYVPSGASEYNVVLTAKTTTTYEGTKIAEITTPDGKKTTFDYDGIRVARTTSTVGTNSVTKSAVYDRMGRLVSMTDADGTPEALTTTYGYDVGNRLTSVTTPSPHGTQTRTFKFDNRGFLEYEDHPELGVSGNGRVQYGTFSGTVFTGSYDARGHVRRRISGAVNGPFDVSLSYDAAERLTDLKETASGRMLEQIAYDDPTGATYGQCAGGKCMGKVAAKARWNYHPEFGTIVVTEAYQYFGAGNRVSRRDLAVSNGSHAGTFVGQSFFHAQTYNDLGDVKMTYYPCRNIAGSCAPGEYFALSHGYSRGFLTSVGTFAPSITYQANGLVDTVVHGSGAGVVNEIWTGDAYGFPRPASIRATNASGNELWNSGVYGYDASGNVTQIGNMTYQYDRFSRLSSWRENDAGGGYTAQGRTYDSFGNYLSLTQSFCGPLINGEQSCTGGSATTPLPINSTTNHYGHFTYDTAGNVTNDTVRTFAYDALGMTTRTTTGGRTFLSLYTPDEERIALVELVPTPVGVMNRITWEQRDFDGKLLRLWSDDWSTGGQSLTWKEDAIYRNGALLANVSPAGTKHYTLDHLGTPRYVSGAASGEQEFDPFGDGGSSDGGALQFVGQQRDRTVTGAALPDYFHARQYDPNAGRFLSPDSVLGSASMPQSWNRYTYALNNPMTMSDPTGLYTVKCEGISDKQCAAVTERFKNRLEADQKSSNGEISSAANVYGKFGDDNGVVVEFKPKVMGKDGPVDGKHTPNIELRGDKARMTHKVELRSSMSAGDMSYAAIHEGVHIQTAIPFGEALIGGKQIDDLNLGLYEAEVQAYMVSQQYVQVNNVNNGKGVEYNGLTLKPRTPLDHVRKDVEKYVKDSLGHAPGNKENGSCQWSGFCSRLPP